MSESQKAELNVLLSGPDEKEMMIAKQNELAMRAISQMGGVRPLVPPQPKKAES